MKKKMTKKRKKRTNESKKLMSVLVLQYWLVSLLVALLQHSVVITIHTAHTARATKIGTNDTKNAWENLIFLFFIIYAKTDENSKANKPKVYHTKQHSNCDVHGPQHQPNSQQVCREANQPTNQRGNINKKLKRKQDLWTVNILWTYGVPQQPATSNSTYMNRHIYRYVMIVPSRVKFFWRLSTY